MHASNIAHRDIKAENILFVDDDSNDLKVIDLGLSFTFRMQSSMGSLVGSPFYVAPEVLDRKYGRE